MPPSFNPKQLTLFTTPNKVISGGSEIEITSFIGPQLFASVIVAVYTSEYKFDIISPVSEYPDNELHETVYGWIPPDINKLIQPSFNPKQLTSLNSELSSKADGSIIVTEIGDVGHKFESVIIQ